MGDDNYKRFEKQQTVCKLIEMISCKNPSCKKKIPYYMKFCSDKCEINYFEKDLNFEENRDEDSGQNKISLLVLAGEKIPCEDTVQETFYLIHKPQQIHYVKIDRIENKITIAYTTLSESDKKSNREEMQLQEVTQTNIEPIKTLPAQSSIAPLKTVPIHLQPEVIEKIDPIEAKDLISDDDLAGIFNLDDLFKED